MSLSWGAKPSPEPVLRRLRLHDAPAVYALSHLLGWSVTLADWERYLLWGGRGSFCLTVEAMVIATTVITGYGQDRAWIGGVLTHPDYQRRGYATRLMGVALEYLKKQGVQRVLLDASEQGRPLYEKLGFRPLYNIEVWTGRGSSYLGSRARPLRRSDLQQVIDLDARAFGVARGRIIRRLVQDYPRMTWVDEKDSVVTGFILAQPRDEDKAVHIGPWVAASPWSAEKLLRTALGQLIGYDVRLDIPDRNTQATTFAHSHDLHYSRYCTRMIYGKADPPDELIHYHYAAAALTTG